MAVSRSRRQMKNSFTRTSMLLKQPSTVMGVRNVTSMTRKSEMPSIPMWYEMPSDGSHALWTVICMAGMASNWRTGPIDRRNTVMVARNVNHLMVRCECAGMNATSTAAISGKNVMRERISTLSHHELVHEKEAVSYTHLTLPTSDLV